MVRSRDVLGPGSPLSRALPGYEVRDGQLAMASAVETALAAERALFVEAGTGTGKTLAYLVPAVLSGKKVVVSTATLTLQEQIWKTDLPLVARLLEPAGVRFDAALMKGLSNYVCRRRLGEASRELADGAFGALRAWASASGTGDRAELSPPAPDEAWSRVSSSPDTRIGASCRHFDECFVTRMKRAAEDARVVVVNHHLYCADLALRRSAAGASVLPAHDAVIFDEAHQLEEIATEFFGLRVSSARIESLLRDARRAFAAAGRGGDPRLAAAAEQVELAGRAFFGALAARAQPDGKSRRLLHRDAWSVEVEAALGKLDAALEALAARAESAGESSGDDGAALVALRTSRLRHELAEIADGSRARPPPPREDDFPIDEPPRALPSVAWIELKDRSVAVGASRVDVGRDLEALVWRRVPSVVCTSATLATAGGAGDASFAYARARLGAPEEAQELWVPSPFDFERRAGLYVPRDLPDPRDARFDAAAARRAAELVELTGGGAFVLTSSTRAMHELHAALSPLRADVFVQGEAPRHALLERFRAHGDAVLVATMSFWEGVDVPGDALRLVVLDRVPFAPPGDPVVMARCESIERAGGAPFADYMVPAAAILLKQGFGRLIRKTTDAGIVALLDRRALTKSYGRALLAALPPARRLHSMSDARTFWAEICGKSTGP